MAKKQEQQKKQCRCQTGELFDGFKEQHGDEFFPLLYLKIEGTDLLLDYDAYSCDSSFNLKASIRFCPFCGRKLLPIPQDNKD